MKIGALGLGEGNPEEKTVSWRVCGIGADGFQGGEDGDWLLAAHWSALTREREVNPSKVALHRDFCPLRSRPQFT